MDTPYGKPAESIKRFSLMKGAVAGAILVLLVLTWLMGPDADDPPVGGGPAAGAEGSAGTGGSVAATTTLSLQLAPDGSLKVGGVVADEATRDQWLNEIRIGAQGRRVTDELKVGKVAPAKADWAGHLSSLVAVMRERQLASLRVEGERVLLQGTGKDAIAKSETESMIQAQLPAGYRLDSGLAAGPPSAGAPRAAAGPAGGSESSPSGPSPGAPAGRPGFIELPSAGAPPAASAATEGKSPAQSPSPLAQKDPGAAATAAGRQEVPRDGATPAKSAGKPANCPRQLRPLAQPVYFKTDAAAISSEDRARLQRLGECLGRARVRIVGHADPRHTDDYNQELSERRARAVADVLTSAGADPARVTVVGEGKAQASSKKPSRQALQRARRVDIQVR